jgi:hypothetical protein
VDVFERLAALDRMKVHRLVDDPEEADVILFVQCHMVDWRLQAIRESAIARRYWHKVMVYDERDRPWLSFPGIYVSAPASSFDPQAQRASSYMRVEPVSVSTSRPPDLLFSFVGSPTSACRERLFAVRHPDAVIERVDDFMYWRADDRRASEKRARYADVLSRSRFVICPRGRGTSSIRLYETLASGRVPVIISDEWVPPTGPAWDGFSVRVAEADVASVGEILVERDQDWVKMSGLVSEAYREFFREDVSFHHLVEACSDIKRACPTRPQPGRLRVASLSAAARESLRQRANRLRRGAV